MDSAKDGARTYPRDRKPVPGPLHGLLGQPRHASIAGLVGLGPPNKDTRCIADESDIADLHRNQLAGSRESVVAYRNQGRIATAF